MARKSPTGNSLPPLALAACSSALVDGKAIRLIPAGFFAPKPEDARTGKFEWRIDGAIAAPLVARANERADRYVIDYEHQTILSAQNGQPAPAAGWFHQLEWRDGDGLYALDVEWTPRAAAMIAAGEYRYLSPVFTYDTDGAVRQLLHVGLTNNPGLDGLGEVSAALAALSAYFPNPSLTTPEDSEMLLQKLLAALGLASATTEEAALTAVAALKTQLAEQATSVATLTAQVSAPDPARFAPIATLAALQSEHANVQGKLAALTAEVNGARLEKVIADGLATCKLTPATEAWARDLGKRDLAALTSFIAAAVPAVSFTTQTGGVAPDGAAGALGAQTTDGLAVMKALGLTAAEFAAAKPAL